MICSNRKIGIRERETLSMCLRGESVRRCRQSPVRGLKLRAEHGARRNDIQEPFQEPRIAVERAR